MAIQAFDIDRDNMIDICLSVHVKAKMSEQPPWLNEKKLIVRRMSRHTRCSVMLQSGDVVIAAVYGAKMSRQFM